MNVLDGAMNSLRQQAQKAANEELKKVAQKIQEHNKGKRLAAEKVAKEAEEHDKAIVALNEEAAKLVSDFEADWGPWNNKPEAVKTAE